MYHSWHLSEYRLLLSAANMARSIMEKYRLERLMQRRAGERVRECALAEMISRLRRDKDRLWAP